MLKGIIGRSEVDHYDSDKLILSVKRNFPSYDLVKHRLFKKLAKKYEILLEIDEDCY